MPLYEYRCSECETTFEKLIRSADQKPGPCPGCGRETATRVFSTFAVGAATSPSAGGGRCENPQPGCGRCSS